MGRHRVHPDLSGSRAWVGARRRRGARASVSPRMEQAHGRRCIGARTTRLRRGDGALARRRPLRVRAFGTGPGGRGCPACVLGYGGFHLLHHDPHPAWIHRAIERLSEIAVPTLVIVGDHDLPDFHAMAATLSTNIPGARATCCPMPAISRISPRPTIREVGAPVRASGRRRPITDASVGRGDLLRFVQLRRGTSTRPFAVVDVATLNDSAHDASNPWLRSFSVSNVASNSGSVANSTSSFGSSVGGVPRVSMPRNQLRRPTLVTIHALARCLAVSKREPQLTLGSSQQQRRIRSAAGDHDRAVVAAEAERVADRRARGPRAGLADDQVERGHLGVGVS